MISSMTGFAIVNREIPAGRLSLELKSVNHRYLEFQCRIPEELRALESMLREGVAASLARGKVDCRIAYNAVARADALVPDQAALKALAETERQIRSIFVEAQPLSVWEVLHAPGVSADSALTAEQAREPLLGMLAEALRELNASRAREGAKLAALIIERLDRIDILVQEITPFVPQLVAAYQQKLHARLAECMATAVPDERIQQEVVLFASRIDVAEELGRLVSHVSEVRRILQGGGSAGKRLDFLMQELNREANTLGSKAAATEVTKAAIELKVLIEQMREQIQNIE